MAHTALQPADLDKEHTLIIQIQQGDQDAFREIYELYGSLVFRFILRRLNSPEDAEDLAAETFIRAWKAFPNFRWEGKPVGSWLLRIAQNLITDQFRSRRPPWLELLPWVAAQSEPQFQRLEHQDEIQRVVNTLSKEEQLILHLHYFEGYDLAEVAEFLGKTANAVGVTKFRALQRMRKALQRESN